MATKIKAGKIVVRSGIPLVIACGSKKNVLDRVVGGQEEGTVFIPRKDRLRGRKRWIAFFHQPKGSLTVDEGARRALREEGRSLLMPGITRCDGNFSAGDVVRICDRNGTEFARGMAAVDADGVRARAGVPKAVVHRDNLVVL